MVESFKPETVEQVTEFLTWSAAEETALEILGRGSKQNFGRPVDAQNQLSVAGLSGITLYEPEELVLSAKAGTPLIEIEQALAAKRQYLPFEPADLGPLLGNDSGASIGGMLACNLSGPRRIKAGSARDYFLGFNAVSGRGEFFKSGGRVVKNVTGYDLCKLLAGSFGTLSVMTDVTIKVMPAPEKTRSVLVFGLDDRQALEAMTLALTSTYEVSGAAHLPGSAAARSGVSYVAEAGAAVTALRVEGPGPSVDYRCASLRRLLSDLGQTEELHSQNTAALWREIRDVEPFLAAREQTVWKVSVPPQSGPAVAAAVAQEAEVSVYYDWGGGLLWLALPAGGDSYHALLRRAVAGSGGHATLIRAAEKIRAEVPVFQPLDPGLALLSERVKDSFDPCRILNPGRMVAGR